MKKPKEASKFRPRHLKQEDKAVPGETQLHSTEFKAFLTDGASVLVPVQQPAPPSWIIPALQTHWIHISLQEKDPSGDQCLLLNADIINTKKN